MTSIQKHMMKTFVGLRVGVGVVGIVFPWLLVIGGASYHVPFADSMSAYYHATAQCYAPDSQLPDPGNLADEKNQGSPCLNPGEGEGPMRNWFVGVLFFIGAAMFAITGFSVWEDWLLNIAFVGALGVALNPMPWPEGTGFSIHYVCAIVFFAASGATCIFCADKTLNAMPECKDRDKIIARYKFVYRVLAGFMILAPLCTFISSRGKTHATFALEVAGVTAFGVYWLVKTSELRRSEVERRVFENTLNLDPRTLR